MKYLVTYWSQTGNTKKIAEAIYDALPEEKSLKSFSEVENLNGIDLAFIGFPIMQFGPPPVAKKFLSHQAAGKRIALFVTHATLSRSKDPRQQAILQQELEKCRAACLKCELTDLFHCQGELSEIIANELMASNIPMLMQFAGMRPHTIGHPDPEELKEAKKFAMTVIAL
jgi:flavodoxin